MLHYAEMCRTINFPWGLRGVTLDQQTVMLLAILISVLGSAWKILNSLADLRERVVKLEGLFEGFAGSPKAQG